LLLLPLPFSLIVVAILAVTGTPTQRDMIYVSVDLMCPGEVLEPIDIADEGLTDLEAVQKRYPDYCRDHCDSHFN
jgi:hypothetical protein